MRFLVLTGLLLCAALRAAEAPSEYQVKAAFLLNFTKFVEWPQSAFESPDSPFTVCVLGDDPFGGSLNRLVEGESVDGRKVAIERLRRPPKHKACQVLFVANSEKDVRAALSAVGPGVLTVGENESFLREGGIIMFVIEGRHVRFDISQRAAANASLTVSARLLSVARSVLK
ncbi:MAG TPA: YfiR family protein [Candidatus Sulfopaludibacter sp.]|nr:YfiR family protein [Candidatus Sulfopaludibacter sp.]